MALLDLPVPSCPMTGTQFAQSMTGVDSLSRDAAARDAILAGHVPAYMRRLVDVTVPFMDSSGSDRTLVVHVQPDYMSVGTAHDPLRIPLNPLTAQSLADAWNCMLPTTRLVDLTWRAAGRLPPQPWGPPYDATMMSIERIVAHNARVQDKLKELGLPLGSLLSGHKKDVVLSTRLVTKPKSVAIFGWIQPDGKPIQPLSTVHENTYVDYSHGVRLVSRACLLDGVVVDLCTVLQDPRLCVSLSDEGPMSIVRQPGT